MALTFGGAVGDDITFTTLSNLTDNRQELVCGWYYPTTLTAGRKYWGASATIGAEIDTTTSEIRMRSDNTTDGQWLTSGAAITTNKWWFIAWLAATENTTVAGDWRVFIGDNETPPTEVTVTNPTVRSGNYTGNVNTTIGNAGSTGSLAFQGDIESYSMVIANSSSGPCALSIATSGVITNGEADNIRQNILTPLWLGRPFSWRLMTAIINTPWQIVHAPLLDTSGLYYIVSDSAPITVGNATVNGATFTSNRPARRPPPDWPFVLPYLASL